MRIVVVPYLQVFPAEQERLSRLIKFIDDTTEPERLIDRKNFAGHITASGFVLSPDRKKLAVVWHKSLHRHLQPGGHVEGADENLAAAALREIREETDIQTCREIPLGGDPFLPIDIDTHEIPPSPTRAEPAHLHHDFRFVFQAEKEVKPRGDRWAWRPLDEAIGERTFQLVLRKLKSLP